MTETEVSKIKFDRPTNRPEISGYIPLLNDSKKEKKKTKTDPQIVMIGNRPRVHCTQM